MALGAALGIGLPLALQGASAVTGLLGKQNDKIKRSKDELESLETIRSIAGGNVPAAAQGALAGAQRRNLGAARATPGSNPNLGVRNALRANREAVGEVATRAGQQQLSAARTLLQSGQQQTAQETQLERSKDPLPALSSLLNTTGAGLQSFGLRQALMDDSGNNSQSNAVPQQQTVQQDPNQLQPETQQMIDDEFGNEPSGGEGPVPDAAIEQAIRQKNGIPDDVSLEEYLSALQRRRASRGQNQ